MISNTMTATQMFQVKDKVSALTHFIGLIAAIFAGPVLMIKASVDGRGLSLLVSLAIFSLSMVLLYGASTAYHSFNIGEERNERLRKIDHMMINVLIAGTYTPLCVGPLSDRGGKVLLAVIWSLAFVSVIFNLYWIACPKWLSSVIYIAMGWACVPYISALHQTLSQNAFRLLLLGGIVYTIGGVLYATKLKRIERNKYFKSHEVFHLFVMDGTLCHFLMVYLFVA